MLATAISELFSVQRFLLIMGGYDTVAEVLNQIGMAYIIIPQYAVVVCSSNVGFVLHCYYSKLYRMAMWEAFDAIKLRLKKYARICQYCQVKNNEVHPKP